MHFNQITSIYSNLIHRYALNLCDSTSIHSTSVHPHTVHSNQVTTALDTVNFSKVFLCLCAYALRLCSLHLCLLNLYPFFLCARVFPFQTRTTSLLLSTLLNELICSPSQQSLLSPSNSFASYSTSSFVV